MRISMTLTAIGVAASCLLAAPAQAATGTPARPDGDVVTDLYSTNGGDNGWGNCGHNSSGGLPPVDGQGPLPGNGGYRRGDACVGEPSSTSDLVEQPAGDAGVDLS